LSSVTDQYNFCVKIKKEKHYGCEKLSQATLDNTIGCFHSVVHEN